MGRKETVRKSGMRERLSRLGCVLLCVCLLTVSLFVGGSAETVSIPFSGSGTPEDPYLLTSAEDLKTLADRVNRVNNGFTAGATSFALTADIDMSSVSGSGEIQWTPIGTYLGDTTDCGFKYRFDGRNHTIRNFTYDNTNRDSVAIGLFGAVGAGADIRNLFLDESCEISHNVQI
ncbi:MAG: hypothetical protein ILO68_06135, partial [Clostridia bacterium]|nr:hypothetical protein [Clostridia bacterium]